MEAMPQVEYFSQEIDINSSHRQFFGFIDAVRECPEEAEIIRRKFSLVSGLSIPQRIWVTHNASLVPGFPIRKIAYSRPEMKREMGDKKSESGDFNLSLSDTMREEVWFAALERYYRPQVIPENQWPEESTKTSKMPESATGKLGINSVKLMEALDDLHRVKEAAEEEGFVEPTETAIENAGKVLNEICQIASFQYNVYPMQGGEVSIETPSGLGSSVWFICEPDGKIACLLNIEDKPHKQKTYHDIGEFPCDFVRDGLEELKRYID